MNLIEATKHLLQRLRRRKSRESSPAAADLEQLARALAITREEEYTCEEVYRLIDQYVELVARGEDVSHLMPLVQYHLEMCSDCREEMEALLRTIQASPA